MSIGHRVVGYILAPMEWCVDDMGQPEGEPGRPRVERRVDWQLGLRSILGYTRWLQIPWTGETSDWSISVKEFVPIMWGCFVWGVHWRGGVVC